MDTGLEIRDYDIDEYVPEKGRYYTWKNMVSVWICANANPTSWYMGTIIGALGLSGAFFSSIIANPIVYFLLALVGLMGFRVATTTMGLARIPFGIVGSKIPSFINAFQFVGWCGVNSYIAAVPLSNLLSPIIHTDVYSPVMLALCVIVITIATAILAVNGAKLMNAAQAVAVICLTIISIWIAIRLFRVFNWKDIASWRLNNTNDGGGWKLPFGSAIDSFMTFGFAWAMCAADYTRYAKTKITATAVPMLGATVGMLWFCMLGAVGAIAVAVKSGGAFDPYAADLGYLCSELGLSWLANLLIVISTIAVDVINNYSGGYSVVNVTDKLSPKVSMIITAVLSGLLGLTPLVFGSFMDTFQIFLGFLGSAFPPCVAIMLVDYFFIRKKKYDITLLSKKDGPYWYYKGFNPVAIVCFIIGSVSYFIGRNLKFIMNTIGSVAYCFVVTAVIYFVAAKVCTYSSKE